MQVGEKQQEPEFLSAFQTFFAVISFGLFYFSLMAIYCVVRRQFFFQMCVCGWRVRGTLKNFIFLNFIFFFCVIILALCYISSVTSYHGYKFSHLQFLRTFFFHFCADVKLLNNMCRMIKNLWCYYCVVRWAKQFWCVCVCFESNGRFLKFVWGQWALFENFFDSGTIALNPFLCNCVKVLVNYGVVRRAKEFFSCICLLKVRGSP